MIKMEMTKERRKLLKEIADDIMLKMRDIGYTGKKEIEEWKDAFIKDLNSLVDEAVAEYKLDDRLSGT